MPFWTARFPIDYRISSDLQGKVFIKAYLPSISREKVQKNLYFPLRVIFFGKKRTFFNYFFMTKMCRFPYEFRPPQIDKKRRMDSFGQLFIQFSHTLKNHQKKCASFFLANRIIYLLEGPRTCRFLSPATENFAISEFVNTDFTIPRTHFFEFEN